MATRNGFRRGLALAVVGFGAACSDVPTQPPEAFDAAASAVGKGRAQGGIGVDAEQAKIAAEAPGFGGMFYDEGGRLNVQVTRDRFTDPGAREQIAASVGAALRARGRNAPSALGIVFREADSDFLRLAAMRERLVSVFEVDGVVYTDIDEAANRLRVGVLEGTSAGAVEQAVAGAGVPVEMVEVVTSPAIEAIAGETLRDRVQPVGGGLQLVWQYPGVGYFLCTLGFNVLRNEPGRSQPYFATNSHCTGDQGVVRGTEYFQPLPPVFTTELYNLLGTEVVDPPFFSGAGCYTGYVCRYADVALVRYYPKNPVRFGTIYRTESVGLTTPGSLDIADGARNYFTIVDERPFPILGDIVDKVGRTTGWTRGQVVGTCLDVLASGTNHVNLCQDFVTAGVAGGDSGSPVFQPHPNGRDATLFGILWGGGGGIFAFSAMENIRFVLGGIETH